MGKGWAGIGWEDCGWAWAVPNFSCASPKVEEAKALRPKRGHDSCTTARLAKGGSQAVCSEEEVVVIATIARDIRILRLKFDECCFAFTNRVNNFVSHKLAKVAITLEHKTEWKENFPVWLLEQVQADCEGVCPPIL